MKKLFTNDLFFLIASICTIVIGTASIICFKIAWDLGIADLSIIAIRVSCGVVLYIAYKKHSKNVMKGMMGALLMLQLIGTIINFSMFGASEVIFSIIVLVLTVALFINHFLINSTHHSSPRNVYINQILVSLIMLTVTVWNIWSCFDIPTLPNIIANILDLFAYNGVICVIVCVESRLDAYRINREEAGWKEENGYPEGYVHQKDR